MKESWSGLQATHREAKAENDRGAAADDFPMAHMLLQLRRSPEQEQALKQFLDALHDPNSPNFPRWLTAQEFGEGFGVAQQDLDTVTRWLESHGFTVNMVYSSGMVIDFSGNPGKVRKAFRTDIHHLEIKGERLSEGLCKLPRNSCRAGRPALCCRVKQISSQRRHPSKELRPLC